VRAVERALVALDNRPFVLSARDFARVSDWHARGIPLGLVREVLDDKTRRAPGGLAAGRALSKIAPAVEEAWQAVREGRLGATAVPQADPLPPIDRALDAWRRARDAAAGTPLGALLESLLVRHASGDRPESVDAELDLGLAAAAPPAILAQVEAETARALAPFRKRMEASVFDATRRRSIADRLRRALDLPRLTLTRQPPGV
jgi:hypothetical protein